MNLKIKRGKILKIYNIMKYNNYIYYIVSVLLFTAIIFVVLIIPTKQTEIPTIKHDTVFIYKDTIKFHYYKM